jgi:hypothetical protein
MSESDYHYNYIIRVIQYLERQHDTYLFITPKDFDSLWNWSEKRIPPRIINESITAVVNRWQAKNKPVTGFSNFKYEVRKNFKAFMELNVGGQAGEAETGDSPENAAEEESERLKEVEVFLAHLPEPLEPLKNKFEAIYDDLKQNRPLQLEEVHKAILELFAQNEELKIKTSIFLKNLDPKVRKPEIERRYRLNYLLNKFHVPDFDLI